MEVSEGVRYCKDNSFCEYPCGPGYEKVRACGGLDANGQAGPICKACQSGKYRDDIATQAACVPYCTAGVTYLSGTQCVGCATCPVTQSWTSGCSLTTSTSDRTCTNCPNSLITRGGTSTVCDICPAGRYMVYTPTKSCPECTSVGCPVGNYIYCYTNENGGQRECRQCDGHAITGSTQCGAGYGVSGQCSGSTTVKLACTLCGEGMERPDGTPALAPSTGPAIQACIRCAVGKYKTGQNANNCVGCTIKPAFNSSYTPWPVDVIPSTNTCPWTCNAGYLKSGTTCSACPAGKYSEAAGATVCVACTTKPSLNSYYIARADNMPSTSNTCPWDCNAGYTVNSPTIPTSCVACSAGSTYRTTAMNRVSAAAEINKCYACKTCLGTEYRSTACTITANAVCVSCSTSCLAGQYQSKACTATANRVCSACATRCPAGKYLSSVRKCSGKTAYDEVVANCIACKQPSECGPGFYLSAACVGTETVSNYCKTCSLGNCGPSQYRSLCGGYSDTQCVEFRTCPANHYLAGESRTQDGACRACSTCETGVARPCTRYEDVVCEGQPCNAAIPCERRSNVSRLSYFCDFSSGAEYATCGVCPHGYGSDGQYCQECPRGVTCNIKGEVECKGQCGAGVLSSCESEWDLGYAACGTVCEAPSVPSQLPWRGSYTDMEGDHCAGYFRCEAGYYKEFATGGTVSCEPCAEARPTLGVNDRWVTEGLSVGDETSCLWECKRELAAPNGATCGRLVGREQRAGWNQAGSWAGSGGEGTCKAGFTSEAQTAMVMDECLACPPLDLLTQRPRPVTTQCEWECVEYGAIQLGGGCVKPRSDCLTEGVTELAGVCQPTSYPWNRPGSSKKGWATPVVSEYTGKPWSGAEQIAFASKPYGIYSRHTLATAGGISRIIQGPMCSGVLGSWNGKAFMFGALCNQSFLVYLDLSVSNSKMGVLIGNSTRGWRDGFRTQALFQDELYVAWGGPGRLFVLDRWNCLLREVVIWDQPGAYRNRVYTVWGITSELAGGLQEPRCYGLGGLAGPRRFWDLPGDWLAFADDDGLWQFNTATRELAQMVRESDGQFEADELAWVEVTDVFTLSLWFKSGVKWTVAAEQEACPSDWTSLAGGDCTVECRRSNRKYVEPSTGVCKPCTSLACGVGQEGVACSAGSDGFCQACQSVEGRVYSQAGTCESSTRRPVPPCTPGWYSMGAYCEPCPAYTATRRPGATRVEQCKCLEGLSRRDGDCVGERLYDFREARLCPGSCALPGNAVLTRAEKCVWECNTGYYRDTLAGFADQCRPCRAGTETRGDDDQPWSCE